MIFEYTSPNPVLADFVWETFLLIVVVFTLAVLVYILSPRIWKVI